VWGAVEADGEEELEGSGAKGSDAGEQGEGLGIDAEREADGYAEGDGEEGFRGEEDADAQALFGGEACGYTEENAVAEDEDAEQHREEDEQDGIEEYGAHEAAGEGEREREEHGVAAADGEDPPELGDLAEMDVGSGRDCGVERHVFRL